MTRTYIILGMKEASCEAAVKEALLALPDVTTAEVYAAKGEAIITMKRHLPLTQLQWALGSYSAYKIMPKPNDDFTQTGFIYTLVFLFA